MEEELELVCDELLFEVLFEVLFELPEDLNSSLSLFTKSEIELIELDFEEFDLDFFVNIFLETFEENELLELDFALERLAGIVLSEVFALFGRLGNCKLGTLALIIGVIGVNGLEHGSGVVSATGRSSLASLMKKRVETLENNHNFEYLNLESQISKIRILKLRN